MVAETMRYFLKYLCLILTIAACIQMQISHAVDYTVSNSASSTPGGIRFSNEIKDDYTLELMDTATTFIWETFQQNDPADKKDLEYVPLFVEEMDDDTINDEVTCYGAYVINGEIHFQAAYIEAFTGDVQTEFTGVLYHMMTRVWQWDGNGNAPIGLITGIADYVRLKSDYGSNYWAPPGQGENWYDGYQVTAFFLLYCDGLLEGFVPNLNMKMKDDYDEIYFSDLLGKSVQELWNDYTSQNNDYITEYNDNISENNDDILENNDDISDNSDYISGNKKVGCLSCFRN